MQIDKETLLCPRNGVLSPVAVIRVVFTGFMIGVIVPCKLSINFSLSKVSTSIAMSYP